MRCSGPQSKYYVWIQLTLLGMKQFVLHSRRLRVHADAKFRALLIICSHDRFAGSSPSGGAFLQDAKLLWTNLVEMGHALPANQTNTYMYVCVCEKGRNDELSSVPSSQRQEHYVPHGNEACATNAFTSTVARQVGLIQARSFFGIECGIMMHQEQT
jgi:hypothetical protein